MTVSAQARLEARPGLAYEWSEPWSRASMPTTV
jgi:hypothetical protein